MLGSFQHSRDRNQVGVLFNVPGNGMGITLFNDTSGTIVKGEVVTIGYDVDGNDGLLEGIQCIACTTNSFVIYTAIAMEEVVDQAVGYFQISGVCTFALVDGAAPIVAGDFLEVIISGTALILDAVTRQTGSCAIALGSNDTGGATGVATAVYLIGEPHTIESG